MDIQSVYLHGQWVASGQPIDVVNPANGQLIGRMATVGREQVAQALADAQRAWASWRRLSGRDRGVYLARIAGIIEGRAEVVARTITLENGKPLAQSRAEVAMSVDHLRWFGGEAGRAYGRVVPNQVPGKRHLAIRSPVGVVGAISPWNFPLVLAMRKVAPALAAGCPVILKPASATPLAAVHFAQAVHEAELPPGVFQLVAGKASEIAAELLENPICRKISFTGSTEVGQRLIEGAAGQVKKLSLELGGHAPVLVFADADLDQAVQGAIVTKFRNTGQSCIAANRVYVERSVYDRFLERLVQRTKALKIGDGLEPGVEIGPLIDGRALDQALEHIRQAVAQGGRVLCGGRQWEGAPAGHFLEPTVLVDVPADALCMREETFAPVLPVAPFDDESEAIRLANDTRYGLAAYAFTRDISRVWRLARVIGGGDHRHQRRGARHEPVSVWRDKAKRLGTRVGRGRDRCLLGDQARLVGSAGMKQLVPEYLSVTPDQLGLGTTVRVHRCGDMADVARRMADDMLAAVSSAQSEGRCPTLIVPVGPVDQYPVLAAEINRRRADWRDVMLINMDEYLDDEDQWIDIWHPLSFRGYMNRMFYELLEPSLAPRPENRVFPDPTAGAEMGRLIEGRGGVDACFGGIGINGHVAFNEPPEPGVVVSLDDFAALPTRALNLSRETRTINSVTVGGEPAVIPRRAVTVGMREILASRRLRLYCNRPWQRGVVRRVLHGPMTPACPASLVRNHPDAHLTLAEFVAEVPDIRLR